MVLHSAWSHPASPLFANMHRSGTGSSRPPRERSPPFRAGRGAGRPYGAGLATGAGSRLRRSPSSRAAEQAMRPDSAVHIPDIDAKDAGYDDDIFGAKQTRTTKRDPTPEDADLWAGREGAKSAATAPQAAAAATHISPAVAGSKHSGDRDRDRDRERDRERDKDRSHERAAPASGVVTPKPETLSMAPGSSGKKRSRIPYVDPSPVSEDLSPAGRQGRDMPSLTDALIDAASGDGSRGHKGAASAAPKASALRSLLEEDELVGIPGIHHALLSSKTPADIKVKEEKTAEPAAAAKAPADAKAGAKPSSSAALKDKSGSASASASAKPSSSKPAPGRDTAAPKRAEPSKSAAPKATTGGSDSRRSSHEAAPSTATGDKPGRTAEPAAVAGSSKEREAGAAPAGQGTGTSSLPTAPAAGAQDKLPVATQVPSLTSAIADCTWPVPACASSRALPDNVYDAGMLGSNCLRVPHPHAAHQKRAGCMCMLASVMQS